jgi:phage tail protein X
MRVYARQGDTVDSLCWRHLGRTAGVVEATFEANPGLAELGDVLPHGTAIDLPGLPASEPSRPALIQLWS